MIADLEMLEMSFDDLGLTFPLTLPEVAERIYDQAVRIIESDGSLMPVVFLFTDSKVYMINALPFFSSHSAQDKLAWLLRQVTYDISDIIGVALVTEGWGATPTSSELANNRLEVPIEERPDKVSNLFVQCEWLDGSQRMYVGTITTGHKGTPAGTSVSGLSIANSYGGKFSTLFSPKRQGKYLN